ncbi:hypothetical protein JCM14036_34510 [Desulfotomaculum defluvii]
MADFIVNQQGAKIFMDISKQPKLIIPILQSTEEKGLVVEVLSLGLMPKGQDMIPIVTIKQDNKIEAYVLPGELTPWAGFYQSLAQKTGINMFPCKCEFGYLQDLERYFAELLNQEESIS